MPTVTVAGATNQVFGVSYSATDAAGGARTLANIITQQVRSGAAGPFTVYDGSNSRTATGVLAVSSVDNLMALGAGVKDVIVNGGNGDGAQANSIIGAAGMSGVNVLADGGGLYYFTGAGSTGKIVAGDGNNVIGTATAGGGAFTIQTGSGNDIILALTGNNTIAAGTGMNRIFLGTGNNVVFSSGADTIAGAAGTSPTAPGAGGSDTIAVTGSNSDLVFGRTSNIYFINGSGQSTVSGGTGSDTVFAGAGGGEFFAGSGGNSVLVGGAGKATFVGTANGDNLQAGGSLGDVLLAGAGNETLTGSNSTGNDTFRAGTGSDALILGSGSDTVIAYTGSATVYGGTGTFLFAAVNGSAGGTDVLTNFDVAKGDRVGLFNYGPNAVQAALATATVNTAGTGATTITLSDNTKITFNGVTNLNSSYFA
jgi:Ca2+-binding RTX toxin-like protein